MKILYPGTFNPWTIGHQQILTTMVEMFGSDNVIIGLARNNAKPVDNIDRLIRSLRPIHHNVVYIDGLVTEFCEVNNIGAIARGVRNSSDFEEEMLLADWNQTLGDISTILIPSTPNLQKISSSSVNNLKKLGVDISQYFVNAASYDRWSDERSTFKKHHIYFGKMAVGKSYLLGEDSIDFDDAIWEGMDGNTVEELRHSFKTAIIQKDKEQYRTAQLRLMKIQGQRIKDILTNALLAPSIDIEMSALGSWYHLLPVDIISKFNLIKVSCNDTTRTNRCIKRDLSESTVECVDYFYKDPLYWDEEIDTSD